MFVFEGPDGAPARTIHPGGYGTVPLGETIPNPAPPTELDRTWKRSASMPGLDALGCADSEGAESLYEPDSSSAPEAANDRLSSNLPSSLPPNETRSLAATEGCWSGRVKRTGESSLWVESEVRRGIAGSAEILFPAAFNRERREERLMSPQ